MKFDPYNISKREILDCNLDLSCFFDKEGLDLYQEIKDSYNLSFSYYNQKVICASVTGSDVEFLIPDSCPISKPLFTHELFHLYIRTCGINNEKAFRESALKYDLYDILDISEDNFIAMYNFLDHIIFFQDFKNCGYKDNEFVADYYENRYNKDIEAYIWYKFKDNIPDDYAICFYISKYIGLRSPVSSIRDYSKAYKKMKDLSPGLFAVCKGFVDKYQIMANEDYAIIARQYTDIIDSFILELKKLLSTTRS